jgi:hypothetical protein
MLRARQFRVDSRRVVHETIDSETILIDLETGTYFSLRGCGSEIWAMLIDGMSEAGIVAELQRRYPGDRDAAGTACAELIAQLGEEGLLDDAGCETEPSVTRANGAAPEHAYAAPVLERYTDMQYFLLLDPIHEVQDAGWPRPAPEADPTETG